MRLRIALAFLFLVVPCPAQTPFEKARQTLERAPLESVLEPELNVPTPPVIFAADGRTFLCYELLMTNMQNVPFRVERVDVYADDVSTLLYSQNRPQLNHPGWTDAEERAGNPQLVRGGERVIDFLWIALPPGSSPKSLAHTITLRRSDAHASMTLPVGRVRVIAQVPTIDPPLRGTNWAALNGPSNLSDHRRSTDSLNGQTDFAQRYAIDWVRIDKNGNTAHGNRLKLKNFLCYGQPVYAVGDATVTAVRDGLPDGRPETKHRPADAKVPMSLDTIAGNHVILSLSDEVYAAYAHLQPGSIRVKVGDHVKAGDVLGLIGDSGNSTEPHLHFQLMNANSVLAAQGLPYAFRSFTVSLGSRVVHDDLKPFPLPAPVLHRGEMPLENEIVEFP